MEPNQKIIMCSLIVCMHRMRLKMIVCIHLTESFTHILPVFYNGNVRTRFSSTSIPWILMITILYLCENNLGTLMVCYCVALTTRSDSDHMMCNIISFWNLRSKSAFALHLEVLKDVNIDAAIFFLLLCYFTHQKLMRRLYIAVAVFS